MSCTRIICRVVASYVFMCGSMQRMQRTETRVNMSVFPWFSGEVIEHREVNQFLKSDMSCLHRLSDPLKPPSL